MEKAFCIGFQKTGTTSLERALQILGYRVASVFGRGLSLQELQESYVRRGLEICAEVDAVQDMPWPLMFRELDASFPNARFLLTVRDEDAWWRSIVGHFGGNPDVMQQLTYGPDAAAPLGNEARYRSVYRTHNAAVLKHFSDRPDKLLVVDLSKQEGWTPVCDFLRHPVPDVPFPHSQQRFQGKSFKRTLRRGTILALNRLVSRRV